jgi:4-amino-4-deoxy-L-arabinose transferase-like glycosyltransferase
MSSDSDSGPATMRPARREAAIAGLLLATLAALLLVGLFTDGLAGDEPIYIAAGHRHLLAGDYALNTEQPPLAKLLAALPLAALGLHEPPRTGDPWDWAFRFIHRENDPAPVIAWARLPTVLLTLGLAVLLWRWTRAVHGATAGLLALVLVAFHPSLLAHGHLVTTDAAGALAMALVSYAYWRWAQDPHPARAIAVALLFGIAMATRLTSLVLVPVVFVLEAASLAALEKAARRPRLRAALVLVLWSAALVPAAIWAAYRFRYAPFAGESVAFPPSTDLGLGGRLLAFALQWHLLPEAYLEGARFVAQHNVAGHPTYLLGRVDPVVGPPYYYLVAFAVKNTPGFLAATVLALAAFARRTAWRPDGLALHALLPAALTFVAASAGRIQIGERYILAVYPYLILLAAPALARFAAAGARGRGILALLLAAHAGPAVVQARHGFLPYFNLAAGGRAGGHHVLADSNLDWGQDLPRLAAWMRKHDVDRIQLAYDGPDDPGRFGIRRDDLPGRHYYAPIEPARPFEGVVVVSPNLVLGVYGLPSDPLYAPLRARAPDDRAGVFFVYRRNGAR